MIQSTRPGAVPTGHTRLTLRCVGGCPVGVNGGGAPHGTLSAQAVVALKFVYRFSEVVSKEAGTDRTDRNARSPTGCDVFHDGRACSASRLVSGATSAAPTIHSPVRSPTMNIAVPSNSIAPTCRPFRSL